LPTMDEMEALIIITLLILCEFGALNRAYLAVMMIDTVVKPSNG
jgi:hypothetical protein